MENIKLCKCGCGEPVTKPQNTYIRFHHRHPVGDKHPRKGMKHTDESKLKIAKGHLGKSLSEDHKKKISEGGKGRIVTKEMRKKMSERQMGEKNHNYGKKTPIEVRKKISKGGKGLKRSPEARKRISEGRKGIIFSEEHKANISKSREGCHGLKGEDNPMYGKCGEENPFYGKEHTKESKKNMSESLKNHYQNNDNPMLGKNHSFESRMKSSQTKKKQNGMKKDDENWNVFLTPIYHLVRASIPYKKWRKEVFEKDNYTCQHCNDSTGGNLNAHHLKFFNEIMCEKNISSLEEAMKCNELWDVDNGMTLCTKCHKEIHKKSSE